MAGPGFISLEAPFDAAKARSLRSGACRVNVAMERRHGIIDPVDVDSSEATREFAVAAFHENGFHVQVGREQRGPVTVLSCP